MNSSLQKNYHSKSTGIHESPFIPSSNANKEVTSTLSPARNKYWYGSPSAGSDEGFPTRNHPRSRTSEYNEKFVEWELPDKRSHSPPDRKFTSLNNFMVDMNVASWQSEQKSNFTNKNSASELDASKVAGISTKGDTNKYPTSFAWNLHQQGSELDRTGKFS